MFICILSSPSNGQTGRAARYQPGDWVNYANFHYITSFAEGTRYVYIGTTHGVLRFNQLSQQWEYPYTAGSGLQNDYVVNLLWRDNGQELWVFTHGGVDIIHTVLDRWDHVPGSNNMIGNSSRSVRIGVTDHKIWIYAPHGSYRITPSSPYTSVQAAPQAQTVRWMNQAVSPENMPNYFLNASWDINRISHTLEDQRFREYPFTVQFTDSRQQTWIGTWGAGFIRADAATQIGNVIQFGPLSTPTGAICKTKSDFWFGSAGSWYAGPPSIEGEPGISRWDLSTNQWIFTYPRDENAISDANIYTIDADTYGAWFGTDRGLIHFNYKTGNWSNVDDALLKTSAVYDIMIADTSVWIAGQTGIIELTNPGGRVRKHFQVTRNTRYAVYALTKYQGKIYAGTDGGLIRMDMKTKQFQYYDQDGRVVSPEKFGYRRIYTLDSWQNTLYYADDYGMYAMDLSTGTLVQVPRLGLLSSSVVRKIAVGPKKVWVGFNDGLGELRKERKEWEFYTTEDGLASNLVYDIQLDSQYIWIATRQGVTRFRANKQ